MYGKMQALTKTISLIVPQLFRTCSPVFLEFPQGSPQAVSTIWWLPYGKYSASSGLTVWRWRARLLTPVIRSYPLAAFNLSQHLGLYKWVSSSHQVAIVLEFQLQHQSFQWTPRTDLPGLMQWLNLLAVKGTLKSLLQHHSSKASILWCSAFFIVQLSHPYMTTGKTIALTRWTLVDRVMSAF